MLKYAASDSSFSQVFFNDRFHYFIVGVSLFYDGQRLFKDVRIKRGAAEDRDTMDTIRRHLEEEMLFQWPADLFLADGRRLETDKPCVGVIKDYSSWRGPIYTFGRRKYGLDGSAEEIAAASPLFKPPLYYPFLLFKADYMAHRLFKQRWLILEMLERRSRPYREL